MTTWLCLSVKQPHTEAIAAGAKPREQRTWATDYRGPLLILSGKSADAGGADLPRGVAVCVVDLVDIVTVSQCPADPALGPCLAPSAGYDLCPRCGFDVNEPTGFEWILANPRRVHPVRVKGQLGLFRRELRIEYLAIAAPGG